MAFDPHANFAISTVSVAPSPALSGTSLTVTAGQGALFPAAPFNATVFPAGSPPLASNAEIVRVTAVVGDVLTIVRAQEGTSARAILLGDQIANTITVKVITDLETSIPSTAGLLSAVNISAGVTSNNLSALTFSNSNGVSFGLTGSVLTATVATNYQTTGAYLTTAALSQDSSKYAGTNGAITGGSITVNTSGVSVNLPAYLTTAMASNQGSNFVQATAIFAGTNASGTIASGGISVSVAAATAASFNVSAGTTSNNTTAVRFQDSNGVSFGLNAGTVTATVRTDYQSAGAYLTTAALSHDSSKYAGTNGAITGGSITVNTSGVSVNLPAYLTTAMQSNAATISNVRVSGGTTSNLLSQITFADSNGVSFGLNASTLTATVRTDYQSSGAYLTTAMASNRGSDFVQATAAFAGTNASGTIASGGISVSVAPPTAANINISAGTTSNNTTAVTFADSNGVSFGLNAGTVTATVKTDYQSSGAYLTTAMQSNAVTLSNIRVSAGTTSNLLSAVTFSNSNGLAFGLDAGTITGSYTVPTQTNQTVGLYASSNTTLTSSGTFDARSFSVRAIGSLTAGYSAGQLLLSAPNALTTAMASNAVTLSNIRVSAGAASNLLSAITFSNSNGVSFGLNASTITATVKTDYLTTAMASNRGSDFVQATAAFAGTNASGTINSTGISVSVAAAVAQSNQTVGLYASSNTYLTSSGTVDARSLTFRGDKSITVGISNSEVLFSVGAYLTTAMQSNAVTLSNVRVSAGTTSNLLSAVTFSNSNGVSFGLDAGTITATVKTDYLTTAMASNRGSDFVQATAAFAGTNASGTIASNGISVSVAPPSAANFNISAGTTSNDTTAVTFANSNGVSFGLDAGTITATVKTDYLTTAMQSDAVTLSNIRVSAGTTSNLLSAVTFSNSNGLAFGLDAGTITGSYTVPTVPAQTNQTIGLYASSNTTLTSSGTFDARSFSVRAIGSLTAGYSGGELLLSAPLALTTAMQSDAVTLSNIRVSAGTTSNLLSAITFSNSNGVSFGLNASTITATVKTDYLTTAMASNRGSDFVQATAAFAGTNASGTINSTGISVSVANAVVQSNQTVGLYASSNTYLTSSGTVDARSLSFRGDKSITVGISNSEVLFSVGAYLTTAALSQDSSKYAGTNGAITGGSITVNTSGVSVNLPAYLTTAALSGDTSKYVQAWELTGNTAGTTSSLQGTKLYFSGGNNLTISGSSNSLVFSVGNYLTTAMASNRGSDFVQANAAFAGTNASGTIASSGISVSVAAPTVQSNQTIGIYASSNTTLTSSGTLDARSLSVRAIGSLTAGYSAGELLLSAPLALTTAMQSNAVTLSNIRVSAGTTSNLLSAITFSNSNGLAFGLDASTITGSYTVPTVTNSSWTISDAASSATVARLAFTNLNGVTLSLSTGAAGSHTIVGSHNALTSQSTQFLALTLGGNTAGTTTFHASNNASLFLHGGNNITLSGSGSSVTVVGPNAAAVNFSAGTTSSGLGSVVFSDSNGISFGLNGSTITGTVSTYDTVTSATTVYPVASANSVGTVTRWVAEDHRHAGVGAIGISTSGNTAGTTGSVQGTYWLQGGNNITVSQITSNNGSHTLVISGGGAAAGIGGVIVSDATYTSGTVSFSNAGNITISSSVNGATQYIRLSGNAAQTNQSAIKGFGVSNTGATAGNTGISTGIDWVIAGSNSITLSQSTAGGGPNTVWIQHPAWLTTADLSQNSSKYVQAWELTGNTAGTTSSAQGTKLYFSGGNNLTISGSSNSLVFSVGNYLTTAMASNRGTDFVQAAAAFNGTNASGTIASGALSVSVAAPIPLATSVNPVASASSVGTVTRYAPEDHRHAGIGAIGISTSGTAGTTGSVQGTYWFHGGNNITVSQITSNNGSHTLVISGGAAGAAVSVSDAATSGTFGRLAFTNLNGITLSLSTGAAGSHTIVGSHNALTTAMASNAVTLSNIRVSAGTTSNLLSALTFADSNGISFGIDASTITASANTVGTATTVYPIGTTGSVGTVTRWALEDHVHEGKPPDVNYWDNLDFGAGAATANISSIGTVNQQIMVFPMGYLPGDATALSFMLNISSSGTGNSSSAPKVGTTRFGLYTITGSTLTLVNSFSTAMSIAANAGNSTAWSGQRWLTVGTGAWSSSPVFSDAVKYFGALVVSTGGNNSNPQTGGFLGLYPYSTAVRSGVMNVAVTTASSLGFHPYLGVFSASSNLPNSIQASQISKGSASANFIAHCVINNVYSYF